jgi:subtilisin family serine protease
VNKYFHRFRLMQPLLTVLAWLVGIGALNLLRETFGQPPSTTAAIASYQRAHEPLSYSIDKPLWVPNDLATAAHDDREWNTAQENSVVSVESVVGRYKSLVSKGVCRFPWNRRKRWITVKGQDELHINAPSAATQLAWKEAIEKRRAWLPIIIAAADRDNTKNVQSLIIASGGHISDSIDQIGYVAAMVPTAKLPSIYYSPFVEDLGVACSTMFDSCLSPLDRQILSLDSTMALPPNDALKNADQQPYALNSREAYLPLLTARKINQDPLLSIDGDIGVDRWHVQHPTWDGRGTTIAIFDGIAELSHPSLRTAISLNGSPVAKTAGLIDLDTPDDQDLRPGRNKLSSNTNDVVFERRNIPYACSQYRHQSYRVGSWNSDGLKLCVLWNSPKNIAQIYKIDASRMIYQGVVRGFNSQHRSSSILTVTSDGKPADLVFTYLPRPKRLSIQVANDSHTTAVATAAAGTVFPGTKLQGIAPGARLVFVTPGHYKQTSMIRGMWDALRRPDVDLGSVTTRIDSFPDDRQPILNLMLDRISIVTNKPIVMAGGNDGATLEEASTHSGKYLITVGAAYRTYTLASVSRGDVNTKLLDIDAYSGSGPSVFGGWGIDISAPGDGVTGWACNDVSTPPAIQIVDHRYRAPPCWAAGGGTSIATPRVAGTIALLVSGAKQQGFSLTPSEIKSVLIRSAVPLPFVPPYRQGAGLIDVLSAWEVVREDEEQGAITLSSKTKAIMPLFPYSWRGALSGKSVYVTRGVYIGRRYRATIALHFSRPNLGHLHVKMEDQRFMEVSLKRNENISSGYEAELLIAPPHPGILSGVVDVLADNRRFPIARLPILIVVAPSPKDTANGVQLTGILRPRSQKQLFFELPPETRMASLTIENSWSPLGYDVIAPNPIRSLLNALAPKWVPFEEPARRTYTAGLSDDDLIGLRLTNEESVHLRCCDTLFRIEIRGNP